MTTLIIIGAVTASVAMTAAACFIRTSAKEYKEMLKEEEKDICRDITFETWLTETDFKERNYVHY